MPKTQTKGRKKKTSGGGRTARPKRAPRAAADNNGPAPLFELRASPIQGRGAFALETIRKGTRIIEYAGQRISHAEADRRYDDGSMRRHHTFLFTLNARTVVDAAVNGNDARFINHSCAPNCEAVIVDGKRIYIEAITTIRPGQELVYDYQYERDESSTEEDERLYVCRCGAPACRGTILAPPKRSRRRR
ncbi:MAG TPA: SET domain-containing protein-lysine N-methyltransferase [Gemmatimonadaceae bacterium]|nr:SET domain-containing protein-lysine N-methyltransferase [Gemmatimonadaceae bacterium]